MFIPDPGFHIPDLNFSIPDPGFKKASDPGSAKPSNKHTILKFLQAHNFYDAEIFGLYFVIYIIFGLIDSVESEVLRI
jgi:hypothetical protein